MKQDNDFDDDEYDEIEHEYKIIGHLDDSIITKIQKLSERHALTEKTELIKTKLVGTFEVEKERKTFRTRKLNLE